MSLDTEISDATSTTGPRKNEVSYWREQITSARKREEKYRTRAKRALKIYQLEDNGTADDRDDVPATPFNILFSNTETLLPALYNEKPRPEISRRFKDENPVARWASEALNRGISYQMDNPTAGYETLHTLLENAVLSALIPGRGVTRFAYDAEITDYDDKKSTTDEDALADGDLDGEVPPNTEEEAPDGEVPAGLEGMAPEGQTPAVPAAPEVKNERVCSKVVEWDHILYGYAKRWDMVPWVAFEWNMTKKDVEEAFGSKWAEKLTYANSEGETKRNESDQRPEETCRIWEIWHKSNRKVLFYAEGYEEDLVKRMDDPLRLTGFFPIPEPMVIFLRVTGLVPVPIYETYRNQARELNRLTLRIEKITDAIKARGFYNASIGAIQNVFTAGDNELVAAQGAATQMDGVSLDKAIWFMPIEQLAKVLQILMAQRESVKQVIYEITGISDILRGSSVPSETATAQNIKNQWGTLRLKKVQKRVQRYVRDCFRIMAEIMAEHFSEETFKEMTGLPLLTTAEKEQMQQQLQGLQQQQQLQQQQMQAQQQQALQGQSGGTAPGAPPGPPSPAGPSPSAEGGAPTAGGPSAPPDPLAPQIEQLQKELSKPSWGDVLALLKDDLQRGFAIDVETDSTVDPEAVEDRQQMGEVLQAFGQAVAQLMPLVQQGLLTIPVMKEMLKKLCKTFRFGPGVEDAIDQMPNQLPPPGKPEAVQVAEIKAQADQQKGQADPQVAQIETQAKQKEIQGKMALMDKEIEVKNAELEIAKEELALKRQKLDLEKQEFQIVSQGKLATAQANSEAARINNEGKIAAARAKTQAAMMQYQQPPTLSGPPGGTLAPV